MNCIFYMPWSIASHLLDNNSPIGNPAKITTSQGYFVLFSSLIISKGAWSCPWGECPSPKGWWSYPSSWSYPRNSGGTSRYCWLASSFWRSPCCSWCKLECRSTLSKLTKWCWLLVSGLQPVVHLRDPVRLVCHVKFLIAHISVISHRWTLKLSRVVGTYVNKSSAIPKLGWS